MLFFVMLFLCFFKTMTAYERRISDWSSDVCSSDLRRGDQRRDQRRRKRERFGFRSEHGDPRLLGGEFSSGKDAYEGRSCATSTFRSAHWCHSGPDLARRRRGLLLGPGEGTGCPGRAGGLRPGGEGGPHAPDRNSTRLNSSN